MTGLVANSRGEVDIQSENPWGEKDLDDEVVPAKAARLMKDTEEILRNPSAEIYLGFEDGELSYEIHQGGRKYPFTSLQGSLGDFEPEEVEAYMSQFGFDRHSPGWTFDVLEGEVDEFMDTDDEYTIDYEQLRKGLMEGQIKSVEYMEQDYGELNEEEVVAILLQDAVPLDVTVNEIQSGSTYHYDVEVEGTSQGRQPDVTIGLTSDKPLFTGDKEYTQREMEPAQAKQ